MSATYTKDPTQVEEQMNFADVPVFDETLAGSSEAPMRSPGVPGSGYTVYNVPVSEIMYDQGAAAGTGRRPGSVSGGTTMVYDQEGNPIGIDRVAVLQDILTGATSTVQFPVSASPRQTVPAVRGFDTSLIGRSSRPVPSNIFGIPHRGAVSIGVGQRSPAPVFRPSVQGLVSHAPVDVAGAGFVNAGETTTVGGGDTGSSMAAVPLATGGMMSIVVPVSTIDLMERPTLGTSHLQPAQTCWH